MIGGPLSIFLIMLSLWRHSFRNQAFLTISFGLLLVLSPLAQAEWRELSVGHEHEVTVVSYYDPRSLVQGHTRKVSTLIIFSRPAPSFGWRATKFLWEADCVSHRLRLRASADFTEMGIHIPSILDHQYAVWVPAEDGDTKESIFKLICL